MDSSSNATTATPKLVLPLGRGNHGKTLFVRWAMERANSRGREVVVADADRTNPTLDRYFSNVLQPESADNVEMMEWLKHLVEQQIKDKFSAFIDLGGGDLLLKQASMEIDLCSFLEENGITPVAVHLIGPNPDDLAYLAELERDSLFAPAATILVLNEALTPPHRTAKAAFRSTILDHEIFQSACSRGAKVVFIPRLKSVDEIESRRLGFQAAVAGKLDAGQTPIGPWDRQYVVHWLRAMENNFSPVLGWLP